MRNQLVRYINVLKDRKKIAEEYIEVMPEHDLYGTGQLDAIGDIIAELEGFVNAQDMKEAAEAAGLEGVEMSLTGKALMEVYGPNGDEWRGGYDKWQTVGGGE